MSATSDILPVPLIESVAMINPFDMSDLNGNDELDIPPVSNPLVIEIMVPRERLRDRTVTNVG
jgi:hypothetical protein